MLECGLELVLILLSRTQEPPVQDMSVLAIVGDGQVCLTQINARHALFHQWQAGLDLGLHSVSSDGLILLACPVDHHRLRSPPGPIQDKRGVATAIGEDELPLVLSNRGAFVLNAKVPATTPGRFRGAIALAPRPPAVQSSKEGLHARIGCMGMELPGGVPAHHLRRFEPDPLVPDGPPEGNQAGGIEPPTFVG